MPIFCRAPDLSLLVPRPDGGSEQINELPSSAADEDTVPPMRRAAYSRAMGEPTDLYERLYFHEIEVREQLNSRLQLPLSLILVLAGAFAYLLQSADYSSTSYVSHLFKASLSLMGLALFCSACLFARAAWWHNYKFVPYANQTARNWRELKEYDAKYGTAIADKTMAEYVQGHFIEGATTNAHNNDRRSAYLHWSNMAVIATSAFALLAFLTFVLGDLSRKQSVAQVSIMQPVEVRGIAVPDRFILVPAETTGPDAVKAAGVDPITTQMGERSDSTRPSAATPSTSNAPSSRGWPASSTPVTNTGTAKDTR